MVWDTFHYTKFLKAPSNLTLNISRDRASKTSQSNLFQDLPIQFQWVENNLFPMSNLNLISFSLEPLFIVQSAHALIKSPFPAATGSSHKDKAVRNVEEKKY